MARRSLLTGDERRKLFEPPVTEREVARFYTLSPDDLNWIDERNSVFRLAKVTPISGISASKNDPLSLRL